MPVPVKRSFLFLQGPLSPLYRRIADELEKAGHDVCRINLCFGDWLHWRRPGGINFRGRIEAWPAFFSRVMRRHGVTDVILHGDQRPYHKAAAEVARATGARIIVTELGYVRPDWMTLEIDGTSAASHFPRTADEISRLAEVCPVPDLKPRFPAHFVNVAVPDVVYNLTSTLLWFLYPHFRRHTIYFPPVEYMAWLGRLVTERRRNEQARRIASESRDHSGTNFILPLQLEGDFQIRVHSPFAGQAAAIEHIVASFSRHARASSRLLVKTHPLDNGLERWPATIDRIAREHGVQGRVHLLDGGKLGDLFASASGLVTINSSAGLEAIMAGVPVKTLGPAIYDVPGLTHQANLDGFWTAPLQPDPALVTAFLRALTGTVQVRGTIYSRAGLDAAVSNMIARILACDFLEPGRSTAASPVRSVAA